MEDAYHWFLCIFPQLCCTIVYINLMGDQNPAYSLFPIGTLTLDTLIRDLSIKITQAPVLALPCIQNLQTPPIYPYKSTGAVITLHLDFLFSQPVNLLYQPLRLSTGICPDTAASVCNRATWLQLRRKMSRANPSSVTALAGDLIPGIQRALQTAHLSESQTKFHHTFFLPGRHPLPE